jgi:hypothetical protein
MAEMYTNKTTFFANTATAYITDDTGDTYTLGVLRDCEVTVSFEHVPLYGMSSILREAVAKHSAKVDIKVKFAKFDPTIANDFFTHVLDPTQYVTAGKMHDTNTVETFTFSAEIRSYDTVPKKLSVVVTGCYFEALPLLTLTENEWVARDMTMVGSNITIKNTSI